MTVLFMKGMFEMWLCLLHNSCLFLVIKMKMKVQVYSQAHTCSVSMLQDYKPVCSLADKWQGGREGKVYLKLELTFWVQNQFKSIIF